jgi:dipeptidyl aminopeptidase/acylaminoacyl peptidase
MGLLEADATFDPDRNYVVQLVGGCPDDCPERYALFSPIDYVSDQSPPTLLLQGVGDFFGFAPAVRRLHHALCRAGAQSVLVEFPNTDHAFDLVLPQISPSAQAATQDVERFLALMA